MTVIEPKIVQMQTILLVGMKITAHPMDAAIPALWQRFVPRISEVAAVAEPGVSYGVMENFDPLKGCFDYRAAVSVPSLESPPAGMTTAEIAATTYAVFEAKLNTLGDVFGYIFNTWPQHSRLEQTNAPYFERYGETFDPSNAESVVEIYIPVKQRAARG